MEIWKNIEGYDGLYQISNLGRVKSFNQSERILKGSINNNGYLQVRFDKRFLVHRLVAEAFLPNLFNWAVVNHKDENPLNNTADNLEWCTHSYNQLYSTKRLGEKAYKSTITKAQAKKIYSLRNAYSRKELAISFCTTYSIVHKIIKGEAWNHVTKLPRKRFTTPKAA